jgi:hypothetical protein
MVVKDKIVLDKDILNFINNFYKVNVDDRILGYECFSDPDIFDHCCCTLAGTCDVCNNKEYARCSKSCNISLVCFAAYLYRLLGVGGKVVEKIELYSKKGLTEIRDTVINLLECDVNKLVQENPVCNTSEESKMDDVLTVKQASEILGRSVANIYQMVRKGTLVALTSSPLTLSAAAVEAAKGVPKSNRGRKPGKTAKVEVEEDLSCGGGCVGCSCGRADIED